MERRAEELYSRVQRASQVNQPIAADRYRARQNDFRPFARQAERPRRDEPARQETRAPNATMMRVAQAKPVPAERSNEDLKASTMKSAKRTRTGQAVPLGDLQPSSYSKEEGSGHDPDYMATQEVMELFDNFLSRVAKFVASAFPRVTFPDSIHTRCSGGSLRRKHADLLARINVMVKLFEFAEASHSIAKLEKACQTESTMTFEF